ncbi:MAG: hypothetical protein QM405_07450 [Euryarchaeota archaeon]|jgi:hypothetical protein|nr:hypothetical protein [Euryarchaeota archaeon]
MSQELENRIKEALENVKVWQRVPTSVRGVFLVKAPSKGMENSIMMEINPLDKRGTPIKRRGIFLRQKSHLKSFLEVMNQESVGELLETLEQMTGNSEDDKVNSVEI